MKRIVYLSILLSVAIASYSQSDNLTLEDCIKYAIKNNTRKKNQEAQNKIYQQNYQEAIAQLLPRMEANAGANFNFGRGLDSETNIYTDINSFNNNYGISSSLVLFDGWVNITRIKWQKVHTWMGKHQLQEIKDVIAYETMEAYFNALYYQEMITLAEQQWQESQRNLQRIKRMEDLGMNSSADVAELIAKEAAESYNLTRQRNLFKISKIRLKEKMQFPIDEDIRIAGYDTLGIVRKTPESALSIYEHSLPFLPTAQAAEATLRAQQLSYRSAKGSLFPTITANGGISTGFARFMDGSEYIPFAEQFRNKRGYYVGFSLSVPLFDGLARVSNVRRSKQQLIIAQNRKEETLRSLYSEIEQAVADMNGQADEYDQGCRQEEAMHIAHQLNIRKYEEGLINAIELHTSSNRLMQAKVERLNARLKYDLKKRLVDYYKGEPFVNE